jgi:hypothetical protein
MSVTHRIRRQRWQVTTASAADAFAVRSALRRENELSLLPALDSAFAAIDDGQREIHLSRLEIAIRISSLANMADELPARLAEAARLALAEALATASEDRELVRPALTPAGRLQRYLSSGQVDWFDAGRDHAELLRQLADEARLWSAAPADAWPRLLAAGPVSGDVFFRFLQMLDEAGRAAWWDFALGLVETSGGDLSAPLAALRQLQAGRPEDHGLRLQALGMLLLAAKGSPHHRAELSAAIETCAALLRPFAAVDREKWLKIENLFAGNTPLPASGALPGHVTISGPAPWRPPGAPENIPDLPIAGEPTLGLPLRSAGLVLLHPYLPRLFAALGWISAGHPQGEPFPWAALPRAAALLNWLATGRDEPFEFELGTAKLLLGLNPDDPLPVAAGLIGEAEREEGAALLGAVVEHWSALGQTSIDGLRVAFLQRGGLLYPAADGWLLRPQGETYDLLLDRLPWGLSIIRLPWMQRSLHTEWLSA